MQEFPPSFSLSIHSCVTKKKRVLETQRTDCLQRTQASTFSLVTRIQLRPPKTQHTTYLLTLSNEHHEIIDLQAFSSYTAAEQDFNGSISCLNVPTDAGKGNSFVSLQTLYIPRKHKLASRLRCSQKHQIPSTL